MTAWSCSLTSPLLKDDTSHPSLQEREAPHRCWSGSSSVRMVAIGPGIAADLGIWGRERLSQHRPAGSRWRNFLVLELRLSPAAGKRHPGLHLAGERGQEVVCFSPTQHCRWVRRHQARRRYSSWLCVVCGWKRPLSTPLEAVGGSITPAGHEPLLHCGTRRWPHRAATGPPLRAPLTTASTALS